MAEENDCGQFLLVLKVSKTTGFAYLMNGDNCYNISDNEKYQVWKQGTYRAVHRGVRNMRIRYILKLML